MFFGKKKIMPVPQCSVTSRKIFNIYIIFFSLSDKDKIINKQKRTIAELNAEIAKLTGEIACLKSKLATSESSLESIKKVWELNLKVNYKICHHFEYS